MTTAILDPVLILGGGSDIGLAIAHRFAKAGYPIVLAARDVEKLEGNRADMALRHNVEVTTATFDVLDTAAMPGFIAGLDHTPGTVVSVIGAMGEQDQSEADPEAAAMVMRANYEGPALIMGMFAAQMEEAGHGVLVGVSSVAGDRGRAANYIYGSAKAGFTAFLSGLRNRLAKRGVHVLTVKPGFVATRMTEGMDLPKALTAAPEEVGEKVFDAVQARRNVIYVRSIWWLIMLIIRSIPERIFKKMSL
ncbi:SDR family oxidoreductase [Loktanella sp. S4079]|uniref:SDR family oxidoreductase n=1 Tax=Loktanella sp. S4079 TaxID=579483 RepID=UPI0005FA6410|nr:SDR family oxidoreductase [Loktanella sp. S4079]KJZ18493.1 short-chain dehydrogenase [Loktanella sp. S4079]